MYTLKATDNSGCTHTWQYSTMEGITARLNVIRMFWPVVQYHVSRGRIVVGVIKPKRITA